MTNCVNSIRQIGCGVAGWFYFFVVVLGYVCFTTKLRKVREQSHQKL